MDLVSNQQENSVSNQKVVGPHRKMLSQFEVICRIRPISQPQRAANIVVDEIKQTVTITTEAKQSKKKEFTFHQIYNESVPQIEFTHEIVDQIFEASTTYQDCLVFGYGVTNSGKTYSILGTQKEPGILPVLLQRIFKEFPNQEVQLMALESYNDDFFSLKDRSRLYAKEHQGTVLFHDYQPEIASHNQLRRMVLNYVQNRTQDLTRMNKTSSRSHAIFKIESESISIAIVDLAGSERLEKANNNLKETTCINTNLLTLGRCIHAFRDGTMIPFRESKLTKVLCEYFTEYSKIFMIAHINRSEDMFHENVNVLEYAAISKNVKTFNPHKNYALSKSAKKREGKTKSILKGKKKEVEEEEKSEEKDAYVLKLIKDSYDTRKKERMERYIYTMIGRMEENERYLEYEFQQLDKRDAAIIEEMRNVRWQSPKRNKIRESEIKQAETRIKMRKQILEELEKEKMEKERLEKQESVENEAKCSNREGQEDENEDPTALNQINKVEQGNGQVQEEQEQSFVKKVIASAQKFTKVKDSLTKNLSDVVLLIKSYSQKKSKLKEDKKNGFKICNQEYDYSIDNIENKQENDITRQDRGCGSFKVNQEQEQAQEKIKESVSKLLHQIHHDSKILEQVVESKDENREQEISSHKEKLKVCEQAKVQKNQQNKVKIQEYHGSESEESVTLQKDMKNSTSASSIFSEENSNASSCAFHGKRNKSKKTRKPVAYNLGFVVPNKKKEEISPLQTRGQRKQKPRYIS